MKFTLTFDMDNAAFDGGDNSADEVVWILRELAHKINESGTTDDSRGSNVRDSNGNTIGTWHVAE